MRLAMIAVCTLAALASPGLGAQAQPTAVGRWKTIDDATGQAKAVVEIYEARDGRLAGRVVEILDIREGRDPVCETCTGARRGKPIRGMVTLWGLAGDGVGRWSGGRVLDPENGKDYKARLELLDGGRKLGMSGCIAFLCRQQVWLRE